jgi:hypothetical protein
MTPPPSYDSRRALRALVGSQSYTDATIARLLICSCGT